MAFDLLLKGGHLIDPRNGLDEPMDVAIAEGVIVRVAPDIAAAGSDKTIDVSGLFVTPGLVDIHTHMYATTGNEDAWAGDRSILPDGFSFRTGVTTMVDTGSAGCLNLLDFRQRVIDRCDTKTYAFVNIVGLGMATQTTEQNISDMDPQLTADIAAEHADIVVGIKTAHFLGPEWISVDRTLEAGELSQLPIMVDFGWFQPQRPFYELVGQRLRPGDIATHMYRGPVPCLDLDGTVYEYLLKARQRGILFDVGHGGGSFVFRNALPCVQQGWYPDSISTDLHATSMNVGMLDMATTMSKFLVMGMSLFDVIRLSTSDAAKVVNLLPQHGHLTVGAAADVAVLNLAHGSFGYLDAADGLLMGDRRLTCELTILDGTVVWDWNGKTGVPYAELGDLVGVRDGEDLVRPPA